MDKRTIIAAAAVAAFASACDPAGGAGGGPAGDSTPDGSSAPGSSVARLPEAGWLRDVTAAEGKALGLPPRTVSRLVGDDGVLPLGFKLQQGTFTIWVNDDDGNPTAHDYGSYDFEPGGRLVLTTMSDSCPGCTTTMTWQRDGDDVSFGSVERERSGTVAKFLWEGDWSYASGD